ncbi:MAG: exopolysaccharide biosynthesis protein [Verrucomicrobia bacterium]|nr:exopolysaccharide biosynthesis protein [Verrucomicrobiota bacterium]
MNPAVDIGAEPVRKIAFSHELQALMQQFADRPVRVAELLAATQGRGYDLLLVCIALPFCTPVPMLGLSMPFGLVVALIGARLALGQKPWLPQRLLARELPSQFLAKVLGAAARIVKLLECVLRPRLVFLHETLVFRRMAGALIMLSGVFLLLPLPVPFSNSLPALTVLLLAAGALERDGLCFVAGCAFFTVTAGFFLLLAVGGMQTVEMLREALTAE